MSKRGKRYEEIAKAADREKLTHRQRLGAAKKMATAKFDETIEVAKLGVDHGTIKFSTVVLPNGTGKSVRVAVFARANTLKRQSR